MKLAAVMTAVRISFLMLAATAIPETISVATRDMTIARDLLTFDFIVPIDIISPLLSQLLHT